MFALRDILSGASFASAALIAGLAAAAPLQAGGGGVHRALLALVGLATIAAGAVAGVVAARAAPGRPSGSAPAA